MINKLYEKLVNDGVDFYSNKNISSYVDENDIECMEENVYLNVKQLLQSLLIDIENDHNTQETAKRVAKMLVHETFSGRYLPKPEITSFPNSSDYDGIYTTGPISIRSTCAHHLMPIRGNCWVGVFPGGEVIGLSKFNRICEWIAQRPQIQEEMTVQIADELQAEAKTENIAVILKAEHFCLTHRGVKAHQSDMTTSIMRGVFKSSTRIRTEFYQILGTMDGIR